MLSGPDGEEDVLGLYLCVTALAILLFASAKVFFDNGAF
jgi:hypothetical protein